MNTLFYSDPHLGHANILKFREGFQTLEEHYEVLAHNYNQTVSPKDIVYFLGDVTFTREALYQLKTWNGRKILILGNHDTDREVNINDLVVSGVYEEIHSLKKYKSDYWLTHCPIHPSELRGRLNIHGHTHNYVVDDPRYLNVCVDQTDFKPISLHEVRTIFASRQEQIEAINNA